MLFYQNQYRERIKNGVPASGLNRDSNRAMCLPTPPTRKQPGTDFAFQKLSLQQGNEESRLLPLESSSKPLAFW